MTETTAAPPTAEELEEKAFQTAKVDKALELLKIDPRTAELAEMVPTLLTLAAVQSGVDPATAQLETGQLADVLQAVYDAWGEAEVHASDERFRAASDAAGGEPPARLLA